MDRAGAEDGSLKPDAAMFLHHQGFDALQSALLSFIRPGARGLHTVCMVSLCVRRTLVCSKRGFTIYQIRSDSSINVAAFGRGTR